MKTKLTVLAFFCAIWAPWITSAQCERSVTRLDIPSSKSLVSPDSKWSAGTVVPETPDQPATLFIKNQHDGKTGSFGPVLRHGTLLWSKDSKYLLFVDAYAADEVKIRAFDVSGLGAREITNLNSTVSESVYSRVPSDKGTMWLTFPTACSVAGQASSVFLVADVPLVNGTGGSAKDFQVPLMVNLKTLRATVPQTPAASQKSKHRAK